jgi:hypothetical protein
MLLSDPVCLRHTLVLPQVLDPRLDQEYLDDAGRVGDVLKQVPAKRPVPQARPFAAGNRGN